MSRPGPRAPGVARRVGRLVVSAGPLALAACRGVTDAAPPALPPGAVAFAPPPVYARWWALTAACAGRPADAALAGAVTWYVVPGAAVIPSAGRDAAGFASPRERLVVLAGRYREDGAVVRHEMLHLFLPEAANHPPAYFQDRCAGVVICPPVGCADEGAPPAAAPADAPSAPASALDVRVEVTPASAGAAAVAPAAAGGDPWLTVVISVTNPGAGPVRVPLDPSPGQSPTTREVGGFGYEVAMPGGAAPFESAWFVVPRGRVAFAAGQTRRQVFDVNAAGYRAGDYSVLGRYNVRTASAGFRVQP